MPKQISVAGKTITLTQLIVAIVLAGFALAGGFFGILQADDRWNQRPDCVQNAIKAAEIEKDFTAGMQQMFYQQNVRFEEQRLSTLYDQLTEAKANLARNPNDPYLRDRVNYLIEQIRETKKNLKELHQKKVN
jgi:flagellar basal body-associated protein FliL